MMKPQQQEDQEDGKFGMMQPMMGQPEQKNPFGQMVMVPMGQQQQEEDQQDGQFGMMKPMKPMGQPNLMIFKPQGQDEQQDQPEGQFGMMQPQPQMTPMFATQNPEGQEEQQDGQLGGMQGVVPVY